jgi:hypothetical protein
MVKLLRVALLCIVAVVLVEVVVGLVSGTTGLLEKAVLLALAVLIVAGAGRVRRLGTPKPH